MSRSAILFISACPSHETQVSQAVLLEPSQLRMQDLDAAVHGRLRGGSEVEGRRGSEREEVEARVVAQQLAAFGRGLPGRVVRQRIDGAPEKVGIDQYHHRRRVAEVEQRGGPCGRGIGVRAEEVRDNNGYREIADRPLRDRLELPDGIDRVAEELQAHGVLADEREDVQDTPPDRVLSPLPHELAPLEAQFLQAPDDRLQPGVLPCLEAEGPLADGPRRRKRRGQSFRPRDHDVRIPLRQRPESRSVPHGIPAQEVDLLSADQCGQVVAELFGRRRLRKQEHQLALHMLVHARHDERAQRSGQPPDRQCSGRFELSGFLQQAQKGALRLTDAEISFSMLRVNSSGRSPRARSRPPPRSAAALPQGPPGRRS